MNDILVLRSLARRVAELASRPEEAQKRQLWYRHNALECTKPLVFCDPENGWHEIITQKDLQCVDPLYRSWEAALRRDLFHGECMKDDRVIDSSFTVNYVHTKSDWGMHETIHRSGEGGAYAWEAPLQSFDDMDKLSFPKITIDTDATNKMVNLANEVFDGILSVKLKGLWWWTLGLTQTLVFLRGLEQIMFDMYDYPDELHRLMAFLRDGHLAELDFLESNNLLSLNNDNTYVGSGGFGFSNELPGDGYQEGHVRTTDMWGFAESQETSGVSPDLFQEFIFPYQKAILERFDLNCYGCCEPLHTRWHVVRQLPRIRRVSVSPWADLHAMAEYLGGDYVFSMKPNPADLALQKIDENRIRSDLRSALKITKNCRLEIIMKDNHTIGNNPQNVIDWCRIAREEIGRMD